MRSSASSSMKAIKPIMSRFFSMSAISLLASGNIGFIILPMNDARKSTSTVPKTIMRIPPRSLGR